MKRLGDRCEHVMELCKSQITALKEAYAHRYYLEKKRDKSDVTYNEAIRHFEKFFLNSWAEGYKMAYCQNVCEDKDQCKLAYRALHQYQDINKNETI